MFELIKSFIDPAIVLSKLSLIFVIVCGFLNEWKRIYACFFLNVLLLEVQLSRVECWHLINRFNPAYFCASRGLFVVGEFS